MRNHNTLVRTQIIEELARCVPLEHKVNLENPDVFILIEIFKVRGVRPRSLIVSEAKLSAERMWHGHRP